MKKETGKIFKNQIVTLILLLGGLAGPGSLPAQTNTPTVDRSEIMKNYGQILEVKKFVENLFNKAADKKDFGAKDCLSPLKTSAEKMATDAGTAKSQAEKTDPAEAAKGIENLAVIRELSKNVFGQALTCLSTSATKKDWKNDVAELILPVLISLQGGQPQPGGGLQPGDLLNLPEPSLEPSPWLSLYR